MRASRSAWLLVWVAAAAFAGPETVDGLRFEAPTGWAREENASAVAFQRIDQAAGTFCRVVVGKAVPSAGTAAADFDREWAEMVAANMAVDATPQRRPGRTPGGLSFVEGGAVVTNQGARYFYQLLVFPLGARRSSVQLIAGTQAQVGECRGKLQGFFGSLAAVGAATPAAPAAAPAAPATGPSDRGSWAGGGARGVWMAHVFAPLTGSSAPKPEWLVLYDDGLGYRSLPGEGLERFDRARSRAEGDFNWVKWTWSGSAGQTQGLTNPRFTQALRLDSGGRILVVDSDRYSRCPPVDGLLLDGAWTSYADPHDPWLARQPAGNRPVIRFTRAGRFVDEGLLKTTLMAPRGRAEGEPPGQGTYTVRDYTLTLRYDDGRVTQNALTGFMDLDPAKDASRLMLRRALLSRMR